MHIVGLTIICFFLLELILQVLAYGRRNVYVHVWKAHSGDTDDGDDASFDFLSRRVGGSRARGGSDQSGGAENVRDGLDAAIAEIERLAEEAEREENHEDVTDVADGAHSMRRGSRSAHCSTQRSRSVRSKQTLLGHGATGNGASTDDEDADGANTDAKNGDGGDGDCGSDGVLTVRIRWLWCFDAVVVVTSFCFELLLPAVGQFLSLLRMWRIVRIGTCFTVSFRLCLLIRGGHT